MQGKILGVPLVLLVLAAVILIPLVAADMKLSQQVTAVKAACSKPAVVVAPQPTVTPMPSVSPVEKRSNASSSAR